MVPQGGFVQHGSASSFVRAFASFALSRQRSP
jgi:hypothetical protein